MTNDAMTKADAARERLQRVIIEYGDARTATDLTRADWATEIGNACHEYGDRRAVEAEIAALMKLPCDCGGTGHRHVSGSKRICGCTISTIQCRHCKMLADAEQREKDLP